MDRTVLETILHRRSIRRFDARQVEPAALEEIRRAGRVLRLTEQDAKPWEVV